MDNETDSGVSALTESQSPLPGVAAVASGSASGMRCEGWEGPCESMNAKRRRQNTRYVDDEQNWVTLCDECMKVNHAYWDDMWADYYSNCM